jgi:hypothetical protein
MAALKIGDYVTASPACDPDLFEGDTFKVVQFLTNMLGQRIVRLEDIAVPGRRTVMYPHEVTFEDGTRPTF